MRFINTSALRLEKVADFDLQDTLKYPKGYAILSHRWGEEGSEIDFRDVSNFDNDDQHDSARLKRVKEKAGWPKFEGACNLARTKGFDLLWIDTCCIDKRDSVELGEAINSMYRWYSEARVCFVYLEDVAVMNKSFDESTWFDRGWTLQELIAPNEVWFYDNSWDLLGDKRTMVSRIESRTGIPEEVLMHAKSPSSCSIAQRMSWAACRQTTRIEDAAYSLMGLFDVNMPMIYGEREKAFIRLQEEIIKKNGDLSIFAWEKEPLDSILRNMTDHCCGMLAPSPECFAMAGDVGLLTPLENFSMGQRGLSITLKCTSWSPETYLADLAFYTKKYRRECIGILLARTRPDGQYSRVKSLEGDHFMLRFTRDEKQEWLTKEFHVRQEGEKTPLRIFPGFWLRHLRPSDMHDCEVQILSRAVVAENDRVSFGYGCSGTAGIVKCEPREAPLQNRQRYIQWMKFGFDDDSNPVCLLIRQQPNLLRDLNMRMNHVFFDNVMSSPPGRFEAERTALFNDRWIPGHSHNGPSCVERPMEYHLFKGSRRSGLDVTLKSDMKLKVSIKRCPDALAPVPQEIWTVDISRSHCSYRAPEQEQSRSWSQKPIFWRGKNI